MTDLRCYLIDENITVCNCRVLYCFRWVSPNIVRARMSQCILLNGGIDTSLLCFERTTGSSRKPFALISSHPISPHRPLNETPLHPRNLGLELLHLPPTIQRPPVVHPQAPDQLIFRLLHLLRRLLQFPPRVQLRPEGLDLFLHAVMGSLHACGGALFVRGRGG